jgi:hypothetical protein
MAPAALQFARGQLGQAGSPFILAPRMPSLQSQLALPSQTLLAGGGGEMLGSPQGGPLAQDPTSGFFYSAAPYDPMALSLGAGPFFTYAPAGMEQTNVGMCFIACRK